MARDDKPVRLRPVDEELEESTPVIRLGKRELRGPTPEIPMLRLDPKPDEPEVSRRLDLPDKEQVELRSFQPGIDVLIDSETTDPNQLEAGWGEAAERKYPIPWGWFVLIGLIIAGAVAWSIFRVEEADKDVAKVRRESREVLVDDQTEDREAALLVAKVESTIQAYFDAKTPDGLIALSRQPDRVGPLIRSYYADKPVHSGSLRDIRSLQPLTIDDRGTFWAAVVSLDSGKSKNLLLEVVNPGEVRVDWETLVCHQPMDWDQFAIRRPAGTSMDFRVYVEPDNFHSHEFSNAGEWSCFRLTTLHGEETLFGYVRAGDPMEKQLLASLQRNGGRKLAVILRLIVPEGIKSRRGVVIEKIICERWIHVDPPDSGS